MLASMLYFHRQKWDRLTFSTKVNITVETKLKLHLISIDIKEKKKQSEKENNAKEPQPFPPLCNFLLQISLTLEFIQAKKVSVLQATFFLSQCHSLFIYMFSSPFDRNLET